MLRGSTAIRADDFYDSPRLCRVNNFFGQPAQLSHHSHDEFEDFNEVEVGLFHGLKLKTREREY